MLTGAEEKTHIVGKQEFFCQYCNEVTLCSIRLTFQQHYCFGVNWIEGREYFYCCPGECYRHHQLSETDASRFDVIYMDRVVPFQNRYGLRVLCWVIGIVLFIYFLMHIHVRWWWE